MVVSNIKLLLSFRNFKQASGQKMKKLIYTYTLCGVFQLAILPAIAQESIDRGFKFFGETISLPLDESLPVPFDSVLNNQTVQQFNVAIHTDSYSPLIDTLLAAKERLKLDDWLYYQLIRQTAQKLSPKAKNYYRYTLYKWFLLNESGYNSSLSISGKMLLLYVQSDEEIFNIPYHMKDGRQFVCLNYHDYGNIDFEKNFFAEVPLTNLKANKAFTYKVTRIPELEASAYQEKDLQFDFYQQTYSFKVKVNPQVQSLFINYPVLDYSYYVNTPLSNETYASLIPSLKKYTAGMPTKEGIDFLMRFTRYAFLFQPDIQVFGQEKRFTPEETLLYNQSDCEDRAALFFYLVKEMYNLPMIVMMYPKHVTIGVNFDRPFGNTISYNGKQYSVCEPTPQSRDLKLGQLLPELRKTPYEVVYAYNPVK